MTKSKSGLLSFNVFKYFAVIILLVFIAFNSCMFTDTCGVSQESFETKVVDPEKLIKKIEDKLLKYDKMMIDLDNIKTSIDNINLIS